jgi:hypothetical protein
MGQWQISPAASRQKVGYYSSDRIDVVDDVSQLSVHRACFVAFITLSARWLAWLIEFLDVFASFGFGAGKKSMKRSKSWRFAGRGPIL